VERCVDFFVSVDLLDKLTFQYMSEGGESRFVLSSEKKDQMRLSDQQLAGFIEEGENLDAVKQYADQGEEQVREVMSLILAHEMAEVSSAAKKWAEGHNEILNEMLADREMRSDDEDV
jgi:hypothetical protein